MANPRNQKKSSSQKAVEKVAEKAPKLMIKNNTPYFKVNPDDKQRFNAYEICEAVEITSWMEVQIENKLFTVVR